MADTKISLATATTPPLATDMIPFARAASAVARHILISNLLANIALPATYVVVANGADRGALAASAKVLFCDGTDDHVQINAALAGAATTGGHVHLTEGTYSISSSILIQQDSAMLTGSGVGSKNGATQVGRGSYLKAVAGLTDAVILVRRAANDRPVYGVVIRDLNVSGNAIGTAVDGIYFSSNEGLIENVHVHDCTGDGIQVQGYAAWTTYDTCIAHVHCDNNTLAGINLNIYAGDVHIVTPVCETNGTYGIRVQAGGDQITGGQLYNNTLYGILFDNGGSVGQVSDVKIENNGQGGIYFDATTSGISQVMIRDIGFRLNCKTTDNTYDVIGGTGSNACTGVSIEGCRFSSAFATNPNLPRYGVNLWNATACQQWLVEGNQFARNPNHWGTAPINVTGTPVGLKIRNNNGAGDAGCMGTGAITAAATAVTITHNLAHTPIAGEIRITPTNNPTNDPGNMWVDTITSTQFNVNCRNVPGASTLTFSWKVG